MGNGMWDAIEGALNAQTEAIGLSCTVIYENQGAEDGGSPETDDVFISQEFIPAGQRALEIGDTGRNRNTGIYQLTIHTPMGVGKKQAYDLGLQMTEAFKRGTIISGIGVNVTCEKTEIAPGFVSGRYFVVPISINWFATVAN